MKNKLSIDSSLLVSVPAIVVWFALGVISCVGNLRFLPGLFFFLFLLSLLSNIWGRRAMDKVSIAIRCGRTALFPGMQTEMEYTVTNAKRWPLVWLEVSQNVPERDCLITEDDFEKYTYHSSNAENPEMVTAYRRTFSFVRGMESVRILSRWTAARRGLYSPDELLLRSGDGFGLTQMEKICAPEEIPHFVVYPRQIPLDVSSILRNDWEQACGTHGILEDSAVLRGVRPYTTNDSWKRINWRLLARKPDELSVNFFETVQPGSVLFLLDGESFCGHDDNFAALEDALEVLGSAIAELSDKGILCGLCLPRSKRFPAIILPPTEERTVSGMLYYLAGYDCCNREEYPEKQGDTVRILPSDFPMMQTAAVAAAAGRTYLITYSLSALPAGLMERLPQRNLTVFTAADDGKGRANVPVRDLASLKKGARV